MGKRTVNPTCGLMSLKRASQIMAIIDMVFGLVGIGWFIYMFKKHGIISLEAFEPTLGIDASSVTDTNGTSSKLFHDLASGNVNSTNPTVNVYGTQKELLSLTLSGYFIGYFYTGVNLTIFVFLLLGVYRRSPALCMFWFNVRCAIVVYKVAILLMYIIAGLNFQMFQIPWILTMVIHVYGLWLVNCYVNELRVEQFCRTCCKNQADAKVGKGNPPSIITQDSTMVEESESRKNNSISSFDNPDELWNGIEIIQRRRLSSPTPGIENPLHDSDGHHH
ncbi:hypothetical protein Ocin01_10078 [Orchesella cincta]|uniref:Transmembrane protein n=1 Tax=Orchesella cincta TaxID=48709 RepID=A0A1D2MUB0_ORCCI|nr:hypothetical protein Ocin01_10078 [Orchesella cincta]